MPTHSKRKLALLLNMISPARVRLYSALAEHFELLILHGGMESNRGAWKNVEGKIQNAKVVRAWGWQIRLPKRADGKLFDYKYLHITPGYLWELLKFRPDVIIANEMGFRTILAIFFGFLFQKPVWVWWGGTIHTEAKVGKVKRMLRQVIRKSVQHWISYGNTSTEYLVSIGVRSETIVEVQNAVDETRFGVQAHAKFQLQPRPTLLHVGQLIARKGIEPFLQAVSILQKEGLQFSTLCVGDGPDRAALLQLARDLSISHIAFEKSVPADQIATVYRSADVLIFPTLEDVWGLVANEAILCGLPVLCSRYAGCAAELFPPENIFDPLDPLQFVEKLRMAVLKKLPVVDPSSLKTTTQLSAILVSALDRSLRSPSNFPAEAITQSIE